MKVARLSARGQMTIPKSIREAAGIYVGDTLAFETDGRRVLVRKVRQGTDEHAQDVFEIMNEWTSAADEEAWRDL